MEPHDDRQKKSGTSKGTIIGTGIICSFVGAVLGAVGYHLWKKEEETQRQQQLQAHHRHAGPEKVYNHGACPICLDDMEELMVLNCGHQYHKNCTKDLQNAENVPKCPICRKQIQD